MHSPVDRINNSDGINGRPVELIIADYESRRVTPIFEQIKKNGGEYVGGTGIPLGTADMTTFLSRISR